MPTEPKQPLHIQSNDAVELDLEKVPGPTQPDIFAEIERFAREQTGGQVAYAPRGTLNWDSLHVDGYEIRFFVDPDGEHGPTMVLSEVCDAPADPPAEDD